MRWAVLVVAAGAACGRIGFDSEPPAVVVQTQSLLTTEQTHTLAFTPAHGGDLLVVATANIDATVPLATLTDDEATPFVQAAMHYTEETVYGELWYATVPAGTSTLTITDVDATTREVWLLEVANATELDGIAAITSGNEPGTAITPLVTPSRAPAFVVVMIDVGGAVTAIEPPFQALPELHGDQAGFAVVDTSDPVGATWSASDPAEYGALTAVFVDP